MEKLKNGALITPLQKVLVDDDSDSDSSVGQVSEYDSDG